jgi:hypothetical protein
MPRPAEFRLTGHWRKFARAIDPDRVGPALERNLQKATIVNAMYVISEIRRRIKRRAYERNSAFTVLLKRSSTPLVDDSDLFNAVTHQVVSPTAVFVGVFRTARDEDGKSLANLAELLHEGGVIQVTTAMRNMFALLAAVGSGEVSKSELTGRAAEIAARLKGRIKQMKPLKDSTRALVIPPRPFLRAVFKDPKVLKRVRKTWEKAVQDTLQGEAAAAPPGAAPPHSRASRAPGGASRVPKAPKPRANRSEAAKRGWAKRRAKAAQKG